MNPRRILLVLLVALLASSPGCAWLKRLAYAGSDRDEWQQPDRVVSSLGLAADALVADLGAGGGYFTFRLADAVKDGRVYAVDIDPAMTDFIASKAKEDGYANVSVVQAGADDARLPEPVDWVFTSNTFHHLPDQATYFARLKSHLKPGGRVAVVEYAPRQGWSLLGDHATSKDEIVSALTEAGYRLDADYSFLDRQSFLVFAVDEG
ncbi:MAG: class I SAM-dependent methyltransferase [Deltaproteobacteria bacterium]|nr:class I SAM-dependent methyltransferase [Deltaproteobacteria bacterium]MBW2394551.1 class I SAM-dependent methyltransferase [Deltaproteobacteria bacterium]